MLYILALILFIGTLAVDLFTDVRRWKKGQAVNHTRGAILRAIGLIPVIIILSWESIPLVCSYYWFLFDGLYNLCRGFNWWFTGSDDKDDAKTDDFIQLLTPMEHKIIKVGLIVVSTLFLLSVG